MQQGEVPGFSRTMRRQMRERWDSTAFHLFLGILPSGFPLTIRPSSTRFFVISAKETDGWKTYTTAACSACNDDAICEYDSSSVIRGRVAGIDMKLLIDTGASKNFIRPYEGLKGVRPVESPFRIHSIHGATTITKKCFVSIVNLKATFFILPDLSSFDAIVGLDL